MADLKTLSRAMRTLLATTLLLAGCATGVRLPADQEARFDPVAFFTGRSQGEATLHQVFSTAKTVRVDSVGQADGKAGLILTQRIRQEGKPPRTRVWTIRPAGPNRFTGTLTEAVGPVTVTVSGPRATISYAMKDGLQVRQQLALQTEGRTVLNRLTVRKWGVRVAHLEETIRRLP